MKKAMIGVIIAGVLLLAAGIAGTVIQRYNYFRALDDGEYYFGRSMMDEYFSDADDNDGDEGSYFYGRGMMRGYIFDADETDDTKKMDADEALALVDEYLAENYDGLKTGEAITPDNGNYYFVIVDDASGEEVIVLTVNPYTGVICAADGPEDEYCAMYGGSNYFGGGMFGPRGRR